MHTTELLGQPYPLGINYLPDAAACISAVTAYLLFRLRAPQELWTPESIDAITGRLPDESTSDIDGALVPLLEHGARLIQFHDFDRRAFLDEGMAYLEEDFVAHHPNEDMAPFYRYWRPEVLERQQRCTANFLGKVAAYPGQWSQVPASPGRMTLENLAVVPGHMVIAHRRGFEDGVTADFHQFVALDVEFDDRGDAQLVVFDNVENPVIRTRQSSWLDRELLPRHGATVVIPPESKEAKYQQLLLELQ